MKFNLLLNLLVGFLAVFSQPAWAAEIAITIDDLPYVLPSRSTPQEGLSIVKSINKTLED